MKEVDRRNYYDSVEDIYLTIYIIGYEPEGESILVTVHSKKPEKRLIYVAIVDSYVSNKVNITEEILKNILQEYNANGKKLDLLCWTHPHDDHTKGIAEIINKYCTKDTLIALPNISFLDEALLSAECIKVREAIKDMSFKKSVKNRANVKFVSGNSILQEVSIGEGSIKHHMVIRNYGPYDNIGFMQNLNNIDMNKLSTALSISIEGINIFLGGDTDNMNIEAFEYFPEYLNFIKIPHHTSSTANKLLELLNPMMLSEVACTTIFNKKLPEMSLLLDYLQVSSDLFCTSKRVINSKVLEHTNYKFKYDDNVKIRKFNKNGFGVLKVEFDVKEKKYEPYLIANATSIKKII